ncbi:hypothetical protein CY34DRAFT_96221 [Suillus luteus UH-Slu-Lm8-n1]|uniref:Uncharacterized protein n=1 Tax=Suillus luteus UH-Slu-Lm8-n1 TaxID=930992 RepID=A0A0D0AB74_9AGAM|nr:hypothetical protein CY34DRAFT_96221 [Suillus luteus UH-Slu-Lm8-n1]
MATIGGEPGGRAAIVVEDKLGQDAIAPPEDEQSTAVPIGAPEPGRDVFAKDKQKEIKSQMIALQDVPANADEKEISAVTFTAAPEVVAEGKKEIRVQGGDVELGEDVADHRKPHGPLDHEEAIADQVAHELYPEARDAE